MPAALTRPGVPPDYASLNARVANFEPESDGDLIAFMRGVAAGMHGQAEALEQLAEHLVSGLGVDPAAVQGITEYAQAVTECAALMARANAQFQQVYQGVRETVANGTVLPYQGRWITGESA